MRKIYLLLTLGFLSVLFGCSSDVNLDDSSAPLDQTNSPNTIPTTTIIPVDKPFKTTVKSDGLDIPVEIYGNQKSDIVIYTIHGGPGGEIYKGVTSSVYKDYLVISYLQRGDSGENYGVTKSELNDKLQKTTLQDMYKESEKVLTEVMSRYKLEKKKLFIDANSWGGWLMLRLSDDLKKKHKGKIDLKGLISFDGMTYSVKENFIDMVSHFKNTLDLIESQYANTKSYLATKVGVNGQPVGQTFEQFASYFFNEYSITGPLNEGTHCYHIKRRIINKDGTFKGLFMTGDLSSLESQFERTLLFNRKLIKKISDEFHQNQLDYYYYEKLVDVFRIFKFNFAAQHLPYLIERESKIGRRIDLISPNDKLNENEFIQAYESYLTKTDFTKDKLKDDFRYILNQQALNQPQEGILRDLNIPVLYIKNKQDDIIPFESVRKECHLLNSATLYAKSGKHGQAVSLDSKFSKYSKTTKKLDAEIHTLKDIIVKFIRDNK